MSENNEKKETHMRGVKVKEEKKEEESSILDNDIDMEASKR